MTDQERLRIESFDGRLRENERVSALQGLTLEILRQNAIQHADKETVGKLQDVQLLHGERLAVVETRVSDKPDRWYQPILDFAERKMGSKGFKWASAALLIVGGGFLLHGCSDRFFDLFDKLIDAQHETTNATEATVEQLKDIDSTLTDTTPAINEDR